MNEPEAAALRMRAETLLTTTDEEIKKMPAGSIRALIHELQVHEIELEMQNEELRQAQLELADARDRYSDLYDFAPVGYLSLNPDGEVQGANLTAAKMLGIERGKLVGSRFALFISPEDRESFSRCQAEVFVGGEKQDCEFRLMRKEKAEQRLIIRMECILPAGQLPENDPVCLAALIEITAQRESEELRLEQQCFRASENEKSRIARQLHDDLGSFLKGIELHAVTLAKQLEGDRSRRAEAARIIADRLEEAIGQSRDLALGLHPLDDSATLLPALERLADFAREAAIDCQVNLPDRLDEITDPQVANHLYRIAQEAIHNAVRHSGASELRIGVSSDRGAVVLNIGDNGRGFDPDTAASHGLGIQIMKYRARAIGGTLKIGAGSPHGSELTCRVAESDKPSISS